MQQAIIRLIVLIIVLVNQTLVVFGWNPIPFSEEEVFEGVSSIALVVVSLWTWYKNNDTTKEAEAGTRKMKQLKQAKKNKK